MKHPCTVCRLELVSYGDICTVCGWEDDFLLDDNYARTEHPTGWSSANGNTLDQARKDYAKKFPPRACEKECAGCKCKVST
jgi:hypothetical protein